MIDTRHPEYAKMLERWTKCRDVAVGQHAVMKAGDKYLPQPEGSKQTEYEAYLKRADVYDAYARTVEGSAGLVFQKPPQFKVPDAWEDDLKDVEFASGSTTLETFALDVVSEIIEVGRHGIYLDMPAAVEPLPGEKAKAPKTPPRPYWISFPVESIVNWETSRIDGALRVTRVVLSEDAHERDKDGDLVVVEQLRELMLKPGESGLEYSIQLWREPKGQQSRDKFVEHGVEITPTRRGEKLDFIPFMMINSGGLTTDVNRPPLLGLADTVISHYRTSAELENLMYYVSSPIPYTIGASQNDKVRIGPTVMWQLTDPNAKAGMIEMNGSGATILLTIMEEKKDRMAVLGARLLEHQPKGVETATAVGMRHSGSHASLRTIAGLVEQALTRVLQWHGWWVGTEAEPTDVKVSFELNKDFFARTLSPQELTALTQSWQAAGISKRTHYHNLQKGGVAREGVSFEEEEAEIIAGEAMLDTPPTPTDGGE